MTTSTLENLRAEAMKLPEAERRDLVRSLRESFSDDGDDEEDVDDGDADDLSPDMRDELERRRASARDGTVKMISAADVLAEIRARSAR